MIAMAMFVDELEDGRGERGLAGGERLSRRQSRLMQRKRAGGAHVCVIAAI